MGFLDLLDGCLVIVFSGWVTFTGDSVQLDFFEERDFLFSALVPFIGDSVELDFIDFLELDVLFTELVPFIGDSVELDFFDFLELDFFFSELVPFTDDSVGVDFLLSELSELVPCTDDSLEPGFFDFDEKLDFLFSFLEDSLELCTLAVVFFPEMATFTDDSLELDFFEELHFLLSFLEDSLELLTSLVVLCAVEVFVLNFVEGVGVEFTLQCLSFSEMPELIGVVMYCIPFVLLVLLVLLV